LFDKIHRFSWVKTVLKLKILPSPVKIVVLIHKTLTPKLERLVHDILQWSMFMNLSGRAILYYNFTN